MASMDKPDNDYTVDVLDGWNALQSMQAQWSDILRSCQRSVNGPDISCGPIWAGTLQQTHLADQPLRSVVVRHRDRVVALLPTYAPHAIVRRAKRRERRCITAAHAGRQGILALDNEPATIARLLSGLKFRLLDWDVLILGVVQSSAAYPVLLQCAMDLTLPIRCLSRTASPYMVLDGSWEHFFAKLPKKLRWTIRKSERELGQLGTIAYEEISRVEQVPDLMHSIVQIERSSWKETAGSSITSQAQQQAFYERLVANAAVEGLLSAHLLRVRGRPIAYILGLLADDHVFLDQKESFDGEFQDYSPGHLLKRFAIERLISRGATTYDLMGECEPYKMKWTSRLYWRLNLALFNGTLRGRVQHLRSVLGRRSAAPPDPLTA